MVAAVCSAKRLARPGRVSSFHAQYSSWKNVRAIHPPIPRAVLTLVASSVELIQDAGGVPSWADPSCPVHLRTAITGAVKAPRAVGVSCVRWVPVRAGQPTATARRATSVLVDPRACGATNRRRGEGRQVHSWFPVPAGQPEPSCVTSGRRPVDPRARGVMPWRGRFAMSSSGGSPRAGQPRAARVSARLSEVDPPPCGETLVTFRLPCPHLGLSPCERGNLYGPRNTGASLRSIPVRVASGLQVVSSLGLLRKVDPRACGQLHTGISLLLRRPGRSPSVRGTSRRLQRSGGPLQTTSGYLLLLADSRVLYPSAQLSRSYGPDAAAAKWRRAPAFSSNCRTGVSGTTRSPVSALRPHGAPPPRLRSSGAPRRSISNADVTSRGAAQPHSHSRHRSDSAESNSRRPHAGHVWDVPAAGTSMTAPPTLAKPQIVAHGQAVDDARHNHEVVPAQKHP